MRFRRKPAQLIFSFLAIHLSAMPSRQRLVKRLQSIRTWKLIKTQLEVIIVNNYSVFDRRNHHEFRTRSEWQQIKNESKLMMKSAT